MPAALRSLVVGVSVGLSVGLLSAAPATSGESMHHGQQAHRPAASAMSRPGPRVPCVQRVHDRLTLRARAGQLVMVGVPAESERPTSDEVTALHDSGAGNLILTGRSDRGVDATAALVRRLRTVMRDGPAGAVAPEVAADQEGGQVQVLSGPGFSDMPTALEQGTWSVAHLRRAARRWGAQLARAGVTLNLSPVLDVVPRGRRNEPIGQYEREFGHTSRRVAIKTAAFVRGHARAGTAVTVKHFPGLGRATGNTDVTADVVDRITTKRDHFLRPFQAAIRDGAPYVMMSSARYTRLDRRRLAAFSPTIVRGMLRRQLGFDGVIISDDLGRASAVQHLAPGRRAVAFVRAGGDMVLSVDAPVASAMVNELVAQAREFRSFRRTLDRAVLRVLRRKDDAGMICR